MPGMAADHKELTRLIAKRESLPIEVNIADSMREDIDKIDREAAMTCVLGSGEISPERRCNLLRKYAQDHDTGIQRKALSSVGQWNSDHITFLRGLSCRVDNEFYRLRALAWAGDLTVLEECRRIADRGEGYSGALPLCEAAMLAGDLASAAAVEFLKSLLTQASSEYERVVIALSLSKCKVDDGLAYLETMLDRSSASLNILVAAALAAAQSARGIERVESVLAEGGEEELGILRRFLIVLDVSAAKGADWRERTREWLKEGK
jgi:hypothetical protein